MFQNLLIATDGSELADKALATGFELVRAHGGKMLVITATDPVATGIGSGGFGLIDAGPIVAQLRDTYAAQAKAILDAAKQKASEAGITIETRYFPQHRPADAIIEAAETGNYDTIVMGSHGRRGLRRMLLGSQAAEVLARAAVPVVIVK